VYQVLLFMVCSTDSHWDTSTVLNLGYKVNVNEEQLRKSSANSPCIFMGVFSTLIFTLSCISSYSTIVCIYELNWRCYYYSFV
jgi:hypothetical protein